MDAELCVNGHRWDENALVKANGKRFCRLCNRDKCQAYRLRVNAALIANGRTCACGCGKPVLTGTYAQGHVRLDPKTAMQEFLERVAFDSETGCWLWCGSMGDSGYGRFRGTMAHRFSFEQFNGPIPDGQEPDHLCRVRRCVNPEHLEAVTHRENVLRGESIPAQRARLTHCFHGHPFDEINTVRVGLGRACRICRRASNRRYKQRQKEGRRYERSEIYAIN